MTKLRIGINGFGRIGRCLFRSSFGRENLEVVAINDLTDPGDLAYLLKYDSVHHRYDQDVRVEDGMICVGDQKIRCTAEKDPTQIPWKDREVDIVIESTGRFTKRDAAAGHLQGGVSKVIISAPSPDSDGLFVMGVNEEKYDREKHQVVSMASCTTNCIAPVAKVLLQNFGIEHMLMTTVHAYTSTQAILDVPSSNRRRGRAAALSIIPSSTGAARATGKVLPDLQGKLDGMALRVPTPDGSVTDMVARLEKSATVESVNDALRKAADGPMKGVLGVSDEELVSADILGDPRSSIVDSSSTMMMGDRMVKVLSWYDNEWGYATRLADFAEYISR